ncbi:MAG TPA: ABC transporter permease [Candidatus Nitrosotalea sp.]|nr:ABC transporter permease [Candidatus Nitrosotalea sp.]
MKIKTLYKQILFYVGVVVVWQIVFLTHMVPEQALPSPIQVGQVLVKEASDGSLLYAIANSMWRLVVGLIIAIIGGMIIGIFMAKVDIVNQTIGSLILGLQSIPSVAWVPLALLWFGPTDAGVIFVTVAGALFAIAINTHSGIKNIPPAYIAAGRNMGASGLQLVTNVMIPAALPYLISGFKQGWAYAWRGVIAAEIIFSIAGLGFLLNLGKHDNDISQVSGILIIVMIVGILVDGFVFKKIEAKILSRWGLSK